MFLSYHGGHCCGVKHIWNFPTKPESNVASLEECPLASKDHYMRFANKAYPQEKAIERLDRYIEHMRIHQPKGLIEIFLIKHSHPIYDQLTGWKDVLLERGFVASEPFQNSNTNNWITMFTLVVGQARVPVAKEAPLRLQVAAPVTAEPAPARKPRRTRAPATPMVA